MTEFQRASAMVNTLEELVTALTGTLTNDAEYTRCDALSTGLLGFVFDPPRRREPSSTGDDDWEVIGQMSAFDCQVSEERRFQFAEAVRLFEEVAPIAERMRRRCSARAELEVVQAQLNSSLPSGGVCAAGDLDAAQHWAQNSAENYEALAPLFARAFELNRAATYGARMAEQASDLVARLDALHALFNTDVVPRISAAITAAEADEAERRRAEERASEAAAEDELRRLHDEAQGIVRGLLAASEQGLERARRGREEEEARRREATVLSEAHPAPSGRCGSSAVGACARVFS